MTSKTSFLMVGAIASVLLVSGLMSEEAAAFEPTKKEQKIIERYVTVTLKVDELCSDESDKHRACDNLELRQLKLLFKLNDNGIYADDQQPDLRHLTEEYNGTREAAQAGIEPIEDEIPEINTSCQQCGDPKTMYVKSAYKDQYYWFGISLWSHYAGNDSADISTGETTNASFNPRWSGTNSGLIPYCQTGSVDLPSNASYILGFSAKTTYGAVLVSSVTSESSTFVWYHPHDQIGNKIINNLADGMDLYCSLSGVTVN